MIYICFILFLSSLHSHDRLRCPEDITRDDRPDLEHVYESNSGHFLIHYDTSTENSPNLLDLNSNTVPDYVEQAALAADSSRYVLTQEMGFIEENDDEDELYDIYILNLSTNLWGQTQYESGGSTFIKIRNNYDGMSNFCDNSNDLLWLTVAHEFFHAIQYSYKTSYNDSYFRELSSMWFENLFIPDCYDFLDFVNMSSNSLFNNPDKAFDHITSGSYGYSLSLFAHYLSTMTDSSGSTSQLNSNIIREIWEEYAQAASSQSIFQSLKNVLINNYETSFPYVWSDFMSRNMYSGLYENMNNDIYYHEGLKFIEPPNFNYETTFENPINEYSIQIDDDKVAFFGIDTHEVMTANGSFSSGDYNLWSGILYDEYELSNSTEETSFSTSFSGQPSKIFFMLSNNSGEDQISLNLSIDIQGCTDSDADNFNEFAISDDGSCSYTDSFYNLYPNPIITEAIDFLTLDFISSLEKTINLSLYNFNGRFVEALGEVNTQIGNNQIIINIDKDLPSGNYYILIDNSSPLRFVNIK
tara:strand:+ start:1292 stop:2872 length:1581 start_codon:yes stop_codon:yes gene_type:complete